MNAPAASPKAVGEFRYDKVKLHNHATKPTNNDTNGCEVDDSFAAHRRHVLEKT